MAYGYFRTCLRFSFTELKKPAIYIFFRNLHLLNFPTTYNLLCFPFKWRAYDFFPRGHPRRSTVYQHNPAFCLIRKLDDALSSAKFFAKRQKFVQKYSNKNQQRLRCCWLRHYNLLSKERL